MQAAKHALMRDAGDEVYNVAGSLIEITTWYAPVTDKFHMWNLSLI